MLYIDFQKGGDCYLFFQGEKRKKCSYYKKSDSELEIIGMASVTQNKHTHTCCFGGALGNGIIFDDGSIHFKTQWKTEAPGEKVYITHMSKSLHGSQAELDATLPAPLQAAHDGLEVVFTSTEEQTA